MKPRLTLFAWVCAFALACAYGETSFVPGVQVDGVWLDARTAAARGLILTENVERCEDVVYRRLSLANRGASDVMVEEIGWRRPDGAADGLGVRGLKAWVEGWQMATPCGLRTADDCDFVFNPDYLSFAVALPRDYVKGEKGRFRAENMVMFRDPERMETTLFGFVTGLRNFGHFRIRLGAEGLTGFDVLCNVDAVLRPGVCQTTDTWAEMRGCDTERLLARYAGEAAKRSSARKRFAPPVGWCSWYYYFEKVALPDIEKNVAWLAAHRDQGFGAVEYIQVDDGYQRALGDWLETNEKFPGGIPRIAEVCRKGGFKAGLWLGPFMVEENSHLLAAHPDWMIHDRTGKIAYPFGWREGRRVAVLDGTHPAVQNHFRSLFREIRKSGFDYVKLDFLMLAGSVHDGVLHDRSATRAEALRRGLEAIRDGFGDDGFILGCTAPFLQTVGLADANRVSADITPCWDHGPGKDTDEGQTVPNVCRNVIGHAYMNGRLWINDPDTLIVRDDATELTEAEVGFWADAVRLTGGSLFLSDNFGTLSENRRPLVLKVLRDMNRYRAQPLDRWFRTVPRVWRAEDPNGASLTARFDFDAHTSTVLTEAKGAGRIDAGYEKAKADAYARMSPSELEDEERAIARRVFDLELVPPKMVMRPAADLYAPREPVQTFLSYAFRDRIHRAGADRPWKFAMNNGVASTRKGRLWRTWTGGEDGPESFTLGARSDDGGQTWSAPAFMVDARFRSGWMKGVPLHRYTLFSSLFADPDGKLHLLVTQIVATQNGRASTWEFVCDDPDADEIVWSEPRYLWHYFTHNKPTFLKDGTWLLPVAPELDHNGLWPDLASCYGGGVLISRDRGKTWTPGGFVRPEGTDHWCETTVVEKNDGRLWMVIRTGKGPMESFSSDGGMSWSKLLPCAWFRNPVARHAFVKLHDGRLVLVKNGDDRLRFDDTYSLSGNGRNKLKAYFSHDDGETWSAPVDLDLREGAAYPDVCELPDGSVYVTWERDRRGEAELCGKRILEKNGTSAVGRAVSWPTLRSYEGEGLRCVKLPLGGIGTGTVSLSGRGALVDWELQNRPAKGYVPGMRKWHPMFNPAFAISCRTEGTNAVGRLLEGPLLPEEYEGAMGTRAQNAGYPRFGKAVFRAAYPFGSVELSDPAIPADVRLEAMNPLVPGDARASGMPVALLRWRVRNRTSGRMSVSVCGTMVNFAGLEPCPGKTIGEEAVDRTARKFRSAGLAGVRLSGMHRKCIGADGAAIADNRDGEFVLMLPETAGTVTLADDLREPGWGVAMDRWWRRFVSEGDVADMPKSGTSDHETHLAQVCVRLDLAPGEERAVPFVLAWRFPHRHGWDWNREEPSEKTDLGNWYATVWPTAFDAGREFLGSLDRLEHQTVDFVSGVLAAKAPAVVREAALFNLSTLRTETCFRTADGNFYGWEGCDDTEGSCPGSCTHVWGYEHALEELWPDLARTMLDNEFGIQSATNGHMRFRVRLPLASNRADLGVACADGQMQCVIKAYEHWRKTGDDAWLARTWPAIRRALSFAWIDGGWDADRDGVMEGCQHNTMDVEYYGPNPQMEFLYLAALKAAAAMAGHAGEVDFAATCRTLAERGAAWTERNLFNGAYYEHKIVPPTGKIAEGLRLHMGAKDLSDPDFQLGAGCLIDQLLGDYSARAVGLGPVAEPGHAAKALATIVARCRKGSDDATFNPMRVFALPGETSLRMTWYPENRFPRSPFPYYRETMTGFEYVVAALLAWSGDLAEAERVVRDVRDRYDGVRRNPFDEAECGHHYARALDAWTVLKAFVDAGERGRVD